MTSAQSVADNGELGVGTPLLTEADTNSLGGAASAPTGELLAAITEAINARTKKPPFNLNQRRFCGSEAESASRKFRVFITVATPCASGNS